LNFEIAISSMRWFLPWSLTMVNLSRKRSDRIGKPDLSPRSASPARRDGPSRTARRFCDLALDHLAAVKNRAQPTCEDFECTTRDDGCGNELTCCGSDCENSCLQGGFSAPIECCAAVVCVCNDGTTLPCCGRANTCRPDLGFCERTNAQNMMVPHRRGSNASDVSRID
jgi:hypothetical protein